jgi:hypothetical protein
MDTTRSRLAFITYIPFAYPYYLVRANLHAGP